MLKKLLSFLTPQNILLVFFILVAGFIIILTWTLYQDVNAVKDQTYEILPGSTSREVAYDLAEKEIIRHPWVFNFYIKLKDLDTDLQAGRFTFPEEQMNLLELIKFLTSGAQAKEVKFTVPEGYTIKQIAELLEAKGLAGAEEFLAITRIPDLPYQIPNIDFPDLEGSYFGLPEKSNFHIPPFSLPLPGETLEGYLFPDTYRVYEDAGADEIIKKMLINFENKVSPLLEEIESQGQTLNEVIVMASILEKEVKGEEDMKKAADILWRRLGAGWLLEVDSTLNYILPSNERRASLTRDQLLIDSPYNTYKYKGLPPTPIGNPGLKAIQAAIYPQENDYWFYLSKPDGETVFSRSLEEHLKNKAKYL